MSIKRIEALTGNDQKLAEGIAKDFSKAFGGAFLTEGIGYTEQWETETSYSISTYVDEDEQALAFEVAYIGVQLRLRHSIEDSVLLTDGNNLAFVERY